MISLFEQIGGSSAMEISGIGTSVNNTSSVKGTSFVKYKIGIKLTPDSVEGLKAQIIYTNISSVSSQSSL